MNMWSDDCDTELCLSPGGLRYGRASRCVDVSAGSSRSVKRLRKKLPQQKEKEEEEEEEGEGEEERPITFFYGDQMCTCDVTEIQARAIICMAKREVEQMEKKEEHFHRNRRGPHPAVPPTSSSLVLPQPLNEGLSMKRSLQWFLQKRKSRFYDESSICSNYYHRDRDHHHHPQHHLPPK